MTDVKHSVVFQPSGLRGKVTDGASILEASRSLGDGIESVCGGHGICGKCRVRIEEGFFAAYGINSSIDSVKDNGQSSRDFLKPAELKQGYRLACQTHIHGDVVVFVPEQSRKRQQVIRKEATLRDIKLNPAMKKYTVDLEPVTLHDPLGDWERLQSALAKSHKLKNLTIDYTVLQKLQNNVREKDWQITVSVWHGKEIIDITAGKAVNAYGLAVDIGTTTVAGYLCDLKTGDILATDSMMNPQVAYGEDVMSRIGYAYRGKKELRQMNRSIIRGLNRIIGQVAKKTGIRRWEIIDMTVVGNTCMHHLFLDINPRYLGHSPFTPSVHHSLDIKARDLGLKIAEGSYVHVLPIEAGFVGADNVGVLIVEEPYNQDDIVLILDIGTNGELIMGNRERLLSTSCATGPAFEGAEITHGMRASPGAIEKLEIDPKTKEVRFKVISNDKWNTDDKNIGALGICGSGIFDVAAQMFLAGIIDKTGRFNNGLKHKRLRKVEDIAEFVIAWADETAIGQDIVVRQKDIRAIQLAKGAMYTGAKVMMNRLGIEKIDKVILAGAFGTYIDKESAAVIGLFPDCPPENVSAVGNAAGDGARIALLDVAKRKEADKVARQVEYIELTVEPAFNAAFTDALSFPHARDKFPSLEHLLPSSK